MYGLSILGHALQYASILCGVERCVHSTLCPSGGICVWVSSIHVHLHCGCGVLDLWRQFQVLYTQQLFTKRSLGDAESDGSLCIHTLDLSLGVYWRPGCLFGYFPRPTELADNDFSKFFYDSLAYGIDHFGHLFDDRGLINAVGGGAFATFLYFVFPALMYREAVKQLPCASPSQEREVRIAVALMVFGVGLVLDLVGVHETICEASEK